MSRRWTNRWPWNIVRGFVVQSCADGTLTIKPDYIDPWKGPEEGGGPGLLTRMALACWCTERLAKRGAKEVAAQVWADDWNKSIRTKTHPEAQP